MERETRWDEKHDKINRKKSGNKMKKMMEKKYKLPLQCLNQHWYLIRSFYKISILIFFFTEYVF